MAEGGEWGDARARQGYIVRGGVGKERILSILPWVWLIVTYPTVIRFSRIFFGGACSFIASRQTHYICSPPRLTFDHALHY